MLDRPPPLPSIDDPLVQPIASVSVRRAATRTVAGGAALIAAVTVLSRTVGFLRTLAFSHTVGTQALADAYNIANQVPNTVFDIVAGGALASIVVPLLAGPLARGDRTQAESIISALLTWTVAVLVPLSAIGVAFSGELGELLAGNHTPHHAYAATVADSSSCSCRRSRSTASPSSCPRRCNPIAASSPGARSAVLQRDRRRHVPRLRRARPGRSKRQRAHGKHHSGTPARPGHHVGRRYARAEPAAGGTRQQAEPASAFPLPGRDCPPRAASGRRRDRDAGRAEPRRARRRAAHSHSTRRPVH